jgi:hypothetical protein
MTGFVPDSDDDSVICDNVYIHNSHTDSRKMSDLGGKVSTEMCACSKQKIFFLKYCHMNVMVPHWDPIVIIKARTHHNST